MDGISADGTRSVPATFRRPPVNGYKMESSFEIGRFAFFAFRVVNFSAADGQRTTASLGPAPPNKTLAVVTKRGIPRYAVDKLPGNAVQSRYSESRGAVSLPSYFIISHEKVSPHATDATLC